MNAMYQKLHNEIWQKNVCSINEILPSCSCILESTALVRNVTVFGVTLLCLLLFAVLHKISRPGILKSTNVQSCTFRHPCVAPIYRKTEVAERRSCALRVTLTTVRTRRAGLWMSFELWISLRCGEFHGRKTGIWFGNSMGSGIKMSSVWNGNGSGNCYIDGNGREW